jgi:hypothetical protein
MSLSGSDQSKSQRRPQSGIWAVSRDDDQRKNTHVRGTHDAADLLHGVEVRTQAAVHGKDLLVDDGGNGQAIEAICKRLPKLDVVAALALVIEAVYTVD